MVRPRTVWRRWWACLAFGSLLAGCADRRTSPDPAAVAVTPVVLERVLQQLDAANVGYDRSGVCFSTKDPVSFEAPDPEVFAAVRRAEPAIAPATQCTQGPDIGRVVDRRSQEPRLLLFARTYACDDCDRSFVLAGWYEHTMSARRYLFIFRRVGDDWKLEDVMRVGAV
jgi:hypothetical protein